MLVVWIAGSAQASYWTPTLSGNDDVNYVTFTGGGTFAIFDGSFTLDATAAASSGNYLQLIPDSVTGYETIHFSENSSGNWELRYNTGSTNPDFTLTGSNTFQLAWQPTSGSDWYADTGCLGSDGVYKVLWNNVGSLPSSSSVIQIDAVPSAVPIPPSAIMLFSGILGLFGVRRMRRDG